MTEFERFEWGLVELPDIKRQLGNLPALHPGHRSVLTPSRVSGAPSRRRRFWLNHTGLSRSFLEDDSRSPTTRKRAE